MRQRVAANYSLFLLIFVVLVITRGYGQTSSTYPSDRVSLLKLKAALAVPGSSAFSSWADNTDPCSDGWAGVVCSCSGIRLGAAVKCNQTADKSGFQRVLSLDLGRVSNGGGRLKGLLPGELGFLDSLLYLDLSGNAISGSLPTEMQNMRKLQLLVLSDNQLTGSLPTWLGLLPDLSAAWLENNQLVGSIPASFCKNSANYYLAGNTNMCGRIPVPDCSLSQFGDVSGTYLMRDTNTSGAYACDPTPPVCMPPSCQLYVDPVWTSTTSITFTFTDWSDPESGVNTDMYTWQLGTRAGRADVLGPMPFTGTRSTRGVSGSSSAQPTLAYTQAVSLSAVGSQLVNGQRYYVTITAFNNAGPRLSGNISSGGTLVDSTPPIAGAVYNTVRRPSIQKQTNRRTLSVSWDTFVDLESGLAGYQVQFFRVVHPAASAQDVVAVEVTPRLNASMMWYQYTSNTSLGDGRMYFARVYGINGAGLVASVDAPQVQVDVEWGKTMNVGTAAVAIVISSLGCLALGAVTALLVMRGRIAQQTQREKERTREQKQVKTLMQALTTPSTIARTKGIDAIQDAKEFAFVITDVEDSTSMSASSPSAFAQMQDIHDQIMREGIAKFNGYEIITEGDSFSIAFLNVQDAVQFCMDTQYRLLDVNWPKAVMKLSSCKALTSDNGDLIWKGPRARMGLHWAAEGTVVSRLSHTRTRVFHGIGFQIAQEVGEAAHGGQVVLTQEAWEMLRKNMPSAGFPVVTQLGRFHLQTDDRPMWLYQVVEMVGRPIFRTFMPLRKLAKLANGLGLHIMPAPARHPDTQCLTFVAARLSSIPQGRPKVPPSVSRKLADVIAVQAQQFHGYLYNAQLNEGRFFLAFQQPMDAVRFCHAAQMLLMVTDWPPEANDFSGPAVPNPDGRWVFRGPRVAMAVHESAQFNESAVKLEFEGSEEAWEYRGPAHDFVLRLSEVIRGGQVVLSDKAWDSVKSTLSQHPGASQVISLGTHIISEDCPDPTLLLEVMPNLLIRRSFKPPHTHRMLEPGYREAPRPSEPMAIVFVKVHKPNTVASAERGEQSQQTQHEVMSNITAYQMAVSQYSTIARKLLRQHDGYECKEPEPGKFTLAFRYLDNAIRWCAAVQLELLQVHWPSELTQMPGCEVEYDEFNRVVWSGLRVKMGMAFGYASSKKPLNTGRADFFGPLPNTAARVSALAAPGQILLECGHMISEVSFLNENGTTFIPANAKDQNNRGEGEKVELTPQGMFKLRGLDNARLLYQATPAGLEGRQFPLPQEMEVVQNSRYSRSGTSKGSRSWSQRPWTLAFAVERAKSSWLMKKGMSGSSGTQRSDLLPTTVMPHSASMSAQSLQITALSAPDGGSYTRSRSQLLSAMFSGRINSTTSCPADPSAGDHPARLSTHLSGIPTHDDPLMLNSCGSHHLNTPILTHGVVCVGGLEECSKSLMISAADHHTSTTLAPIITGRGEVGMGHRVHEDTDPSSACSSTPQHPGSWTPPPAPPREVNQLETTGDNSPILSRPPSFLTHFSSAGSGRSEPPPTAELAASSSSSKPPPPRKRKTFSLRIRRSPPIKGIHFSRLQRGSAYSPTSSASNSPNRQPRLNGGEDEDGRVDAPESARSDGSVTGDYAKAVAMTYLNSKRVTYPVDSPSRHSMGRAASLNIHQSRHETFDIMRSISPQPSETSATRANSLPTRRSSLPNAPSPPNTPPSNTSPRTHPAMNPFLHSHPVLMADVFCPAPSALSASSTESVSREGSFVHHSAGSYDQLQHDLVMAKRKPISAFSLPPHSSPRNPLNHTPSISPLGRNSSLNNTPPFLAITPPTFTPTPSSSRPTRMGSLSPSHSNPTMLSPALSLESRTSLQVSETQPSAASRLVSMLSLRNHTKKQQQQHE